MKISRRIFLTGAALAGIGKAADEEFTDRETSIVFIPGEGEFGIGVRTPFVCDVIKVEVFYQIQSPYGSTDGKPVTLLIHQESWAPDAGNNGYGATARNFTCPRDQVQFVRLTFLKELGKREVKVPK